MQRIIQTMGNSFKRLKINISNFSANRVNTGVNTSVQNEETVLFTDLPDDVLFVIMSFLPSKDIILRFSQLNKLTNKLAKTNTPWNDPVYSTVKYNSLESIPETWRITNLNIIIEYFPQLRRNLPSCYMDYILENTLPPGHRQIRLDHTNYTTVEENTCAAIISHDNNKIEKIIKKSSDIILDKNIKDGVFKGERIIALAY